MQPVAIFDLDNTLVRGSSLYHFGKYLVRRKALGLGTLSRFALAQGRYLRGAGEQEEAAAKAARIGLGLLADQSERVMQALADDFASALPQRHFDGSALRELARLQDGSAACFIATASPQELADALARRLGMDGAFGTMLEVVDGNYTGQLAGPVCHGEIKAQRVRHGLWARGFELSEALAYSDSVNDLPLLASAREAVAVNADSELLVIAERNNWRTISGPRDQARSVGRALAYLPFPM